MKEYLSQIVAISSVLAIAGDPVNDEELGLMTLNGLGKEYETFVTVVTTQSEPVLFVDLQSMLINQENMQRRSINMNPCLKNGVQGDPNLNLQTIHCQICSKKGHEALNCFNQLNLKCFPPTYIRKNNVSANLC